MKSFRQWHTKLIAFWVRYGPDINEAFGPVAEVVTIGTIASWIALGPYGTIIFVIGLGTVRYWAYRHRTNPTKPVDPDVQLTAAEVEPGSRHE